MSGQRIYSSGDDLGFLNGTAYLQLLLAGLFLPAQSFRRALFQPGAVRVPPSWQDIDLKCKLSTLLAEPSLDSEAGCGHSES